MASRARIVEPSLSWKIEVVAGFLLSLCGFVWLAMSLPPRPIALADRFGYLSALLCVLALNGICWVLMFAYLGRRRNWSPVACQCSSLFYLLPGVLFVCLNLIFLGEYRFPAIGMPLVLTGIFVGKFCRRMVYPTLTDEQFYEQAHKPFSLFGK